jgi:hypothetical protein
VENLQEITQTTIETKNFGKASLPFLSGNQEQLQHPNKKLAYIGFHGTEKRRDLAYTQLGAKSENIFIGVHDEVSWEYAEVGFNGDNGFCHVFAPESDLKQWDPFIIGLDMIMPMTRLFNGEHVYESFSMAKVRDITEIMIKSAGSVLVFATQPKHVYQLMKHRDLSLSDIHYVFGYTFALKSIFGKNLVYVCEDTGKESFLKDLSTLREQSQVFRRIRRLNLPWYFTKQRLLRAMRFA